MTILWLCGALSAKTASDKLVFNRAVRRSAKVWNKHTGPAELGHLALDKKDTLGRYNTEIPPWREIEQVSS